MSYLYHSGIGLHTTYRSNICDISRRLLGRKGSLMCRRHRWHHTEPPQFYFSSDDATNKASGSSRFVGKRHRYHHSIIELTNSQVLSKCSRASTDANSRPSNYRNKNTDDSNISATTSKDSAIRWLNFNGHFYISLFFLREAAFCTGWCKKKYWFLVRKAEFLVWREYSLVTTLTSRTSTVHVDRWRPFLTAVAKNRSKLNVVI